MSDPAGPGRGRRRAWLGGLALVALAAFGGLIWLAYDADIRQQAEIGPPLIRAPDGPARIRPQDPGGMTVPNRDVLIFDAVGKPNGAAPAGAERLLPAPEQPVPPPPAMVEEAPPVPAAPAVTPEAPAEPATATPPPPAAGEPAWRVQIAAFRDRAAAERAWSRLRQRLAPLVAGLAWRIAVADLADKGLYYRLQIGRFTDKAAADALCRELKDQKQGCFLVSPKK